LYQKAVDGTVEDFEQRQATLTERGEREDTLVVFTSDHGEYLGEAGLVDHTSPARPEGVYVPTVFLHPDIEGGTELNGVMRHVDFFPTLLGALGIEPPSHVDGIDLARGVPERGYSLSRATTHLSGEVRTLYNAPSVWDADGGHAFNRTPYLKRLVVSAGMVLGSDWKSMHLRRTPQQMPAALRHYRGHSRTYGSPNFDRETA